MRKRIATVLGAAAAALMLTTTTASADTVITDDGNFILWQRTCNTSYSGTVSKTKAITAKGNNGSCAGYAWLRVLGDSWGSWQHGATSKTLTSPRSSPDLARSGGGLRTAITDIRDVCASLTPYRLALHARRGVGLGGTRGA